MKRILANDGIHPLGKKMLEEAGFEVITLKISQAELANQIGQYDGLIVRSATKVKPADLVNHGNLKIIGRAGVGLDNIDVDFAKSIGIEVFNTPAASSKAVASLAIALMLNISRKLHESSVAMPIDGSTKFAELKKQLAGGFELSGRKLGIIGFGRIGQELAKMAVGLGMEIMAYDAFYQPESLLCDFAGHTINIQLNKYSFDDVLQQADIVSFHVPSQKDGALIRQEQINMMKPGVVLINTSRGGIIDEQLLIEALNNGQVKAAGLDVFVNEPTPNQSLLSHPKVVSTPHIGAETNEAQTRIGIELAQKIIGFFK
jgi:D-3-phosphoglycerate dehydrogenase